MSVTRLDSHKRTKNSVSTLKHDLWTRPLSLRVSLSNAKEKIGQL